jgi:hypothetical protein
MSATFETPSIFFRIREQSSHEESELWDGSGRGYPTIRDDDGASHGYGLQLETVARPVVG